MDLTDGTLLGGRVRYRQPRVGYRTGIEPVLLAASVPATAGERVVEAGTGAGAGLLCLMARVPGVLAVGIEREPGLAGLAEANITANGAVACVIPADLLALPDMIIRTWEPFDHAMANPPWHGARSTASPNDMRDGAKRASETLFHDWAAVLASLLRPGGTMTLIVPAASVAAALSATAEAGFGDLTLLPLWPHAGQEARLLLIRGMKASRGACRLLPGLVLHDSVGYTDQARRILWDAACLP